MSEWVGRFFDVHNVILRFAGYELSVLELTGTLLSLLSVWLVVKKSIWTWPIGNVAVILFAALFYQIRLYSDFVEQIYFLVTGFYGWWIWIRMGRRPDAEETQGIGILKHNWRVLCVIGLILGTWLLGGVTSRVHVWFPAYFPEPASLPYWDAGTTAMSLVANLLMAHKKIECWVLWIVVDVIGIWLYVSKGVIFVAGLYVVFLVLAVTGLVEWKKELRAREA